jgi:hypothetical protein
MAIEIGKLYYFIVHAYHPFIGEVGEIVGRREVQLVQHKHGIIRVQGCQRGWTEFFRDGLKADSNFSWWPDGLVLSGWFVAAPWNHPVPLPPEARYEGRR